MALNVFVFGTLKRGFSLHEQGLSHAEFLGIYTTRACYPMLIAGPRFAPMMFNEPGVGLRVFGEVYAVDDKTIAILDRLESIGKSRNLRVSIEVEPAKGGPACMAITYMKARSLADPVHSGYLHTYQDNRFKQVERRLENF